MLEISELLSIFGDLDPKNKEVLYDFLVDPRTYKDKDDIKEFRQLLKEKKEDLFYCNEKMGPSEKKFRKAMAEFDYDIRWDTITMENLKKISEEEYQYWVNVIEEKYDVLKAIGFEKIGLVTYYFDRINKTTTSHAETNLNVLSKDRIEKWDDTEEEKFDLWIKIIEKVSGKPLVKENEDLDDNQTDILEEKLSPKIIDKYIEIIKDNEQRIKDFIIFAHTTAIRDYINMRVSVSRDGDIWYEELPPCENYPVKNGYKIGGLKNDYLSIIEIVKDMFSLEADEAAYTPFSKKLFKKREEFANKCYNILIKTLEESKKENQIVFHWFDPQLNELHL